MSKQFDSVNIEPAHRGPRRKYPEGIVYNRRQPAKVEKTEWGKLPIITDQQKKFVFAYVGEANCNNNKAAEIAGYLDPRREGYRVHKRKDVTAWIEAILKSRCMSPNEVLERITRIARGSYADIDLNDPESIKDAANQGIIRGFGINEYPNGGKSMKIELEPKLPALAQYAKLIGMENASDSNNVNVNVLNMTDAQLDAAIKQLSAPNASEDIEGEFEAEDLEDDEEESVDSEEIE